MQHVCIHAEVHLPPPVPRTTENSRTQADVMVSVLLLLYKRTTGSGPALTNYLLLFFEYFELEYLGILKQASSSREGP